MSLLFKCKDVELLNEERLSESSVPSVLHLVFVKCYINSLERGEQDLKKYIAEFSKYSSERLMAAFKCDKVKDLLDEAYSYTRSVVESLRNIGMSVIVLRGELTTRLVIHTRTPQMPLEVGLAWDPYINLPYIPATALKGIVRDYFETHDVKIGSHDYNELFGSRQSEGLLIFFDSYPVACRSELIHPEVMTPHYREVEGNISEVEVRPTPIVYPTVAPGTIFHIPLAIRKELKSEEINPLINNVIKALEGGVGAKTSIGYGYMRVSRL
ncbi:MAG: type III-B CRISPR module RAMP protein Cmr6 [Sulfolobales archaeon]|nr:type III-B CRISPR module RAMP protein Cmr6 [Sulfolobales archaeon]